MCSEQTLRNWNKTELLKTCLFYIYNLSVDTFYQCFESLQIVENYIVEIVTFFFVEYSACQSLRVSINGNLPKMD